MYGAQPVIRNLSLLLSKKKYTVFVLLDLCFFWSGNSLSARDIRTTGQIWSRRKSPLDRVACTENAGQGKYPSFSWKSRWKS